MHFNNIVLDRLRKIGSHLKGDSDLMADRMTHGKFQNIKCSYGTEALSTFPTFPIGVPGLDAGYSFPNEKIEDSKMIFTR